MQSFLEPGNLNIEPQNFRCEGAPFNEFLGSRNTPLPPGNSHRQIINWPHPCGKRPGNGYAKRQSPTTSCRLTRVWQREYSVPRKAKEVPRSLRLWVTHRPQPYNLRTNHNHLQDVWS